MRRAMKSRRGVTAIFVALVVLLPLACAQNETAPAAEPAPATPAGNVSATPAGNVSAPAAAATPPPVQVVLDPPPNEQGNPGLVVCPGILIDYVINSLNFVPNPSGNVYAFDATIFFQNIGNVNLVNWRVSIGYQWNEQITRVVNLTLPTGAATPVLGNSTVFGAPSNYTTLLSAVNAAGDRSLYITQAQLVGTETGAVNTSQALPQYVRVIAPGVTCSPANIVSPTNQSNVLRSCCITGSAAAPGPSPIAAPAPLALVSAPQNVSQCPAGVVVDYAITSLDPIPGQAGAYQFASLVTLANNAASALQNWGLSFQFAQNQLISIVNGLSVAPGYRLPAPGSGTVFVPPNGSYVNTTAQAAGNSSLYTYLASFSGNEVGADNARDALPTAVDIGVAGFACDPTNFSYPVNTTNVLRACCLPVAPPAALPVCPGVTVDYSVDSLAPIPDPSNQAYRFNATVVVANVGSRVLPPWTLTFGFQNQEIIATTQNLVVPATTPLPAPGNSTVFGAPPSAPTLPNAALVAGDPSKYALRASIEGTEFGASTLRAALPSSISLVAPGIACSPANLTAATGTAASLRQCCIEVALPPAPAPLPPAPVCQGVQINYTVLSLTNIPDPTGLAYGFQSLLTVANTGTRDLQGYQVRMDWRNNEVISDVSNWDLGDQYLPRPGNITVFISPASKPYLFTAVEAVGNRSIYTSSGTISGTERGATTLAAALPGGIVLQAPGYTCPDGNLSFPSALNNSAVQCCTEIPLPPAPAPAPLPFSSQNYTGVLINWDIVNANASTYLVQIRVTNQNRYTTINGGWSVGWIWQNNEFIWSVVNGYVGSFGDCSTHPAVNDYPDFGVQVSTSQGSCSNTPSLIQNTDQKGILTGQGINVQNSTANFTVLAGKTARQFAISTIIVPQNFSIGLPGWACNPPLKVAGRNVPFGTISGQVIPAYASYNITCGPTQPNATLPKCCVSMSAFFNQTVAPCKSCACGNCPGKGEPPLAPVPSGTGLVPAPGTCNFNSSSLPTVASQVAIGVAQAGRVYPAPLAGRCEDGCPSNIHFDISGAGDGGWNVKIVAANRLPVNVPDWLLVMELPELNYLQSVFSVDWRRDAGASRPTMLFYGIKGYNDVVLPAGNVEWILAFNFTGNSSLRGTLGGTGVRPLAEANSNSFPTRIWFNGDECEMPPRDTWPISLAQYNNLTRVAPAVRLVISTRHVALSSMLAVLLAIFLS